MALFSDEMSCVHQFSAKPPQTGSCKREEMTQSCLLISLLGIKRGEKGSGRPRHFPFFPTLSSSSERATLSSCTSFDLAARSRCCIWRRSNWGLLRSFSTSRLFASLAINPFSSFPSFSSSFFSAESKATSRLRRRSNLQ